MLLQSLTSRPLPAKTTRHAHNREYKTMVASHLLSICQHVDLNDPVLIVLDVKIKVREQVMLVLHIPGLRDELLDSPNEAPHRQVIVVHLEVPVILHSLWTTMWGLRLVSIKQQYNTTWRVVEMSCCIWCIAKLTVEGCRVIRANRVQKALRLCWCTSSSCPSSIKVPMLFLLLQSATNVASIMVC